MQASYILILGWATWAFLLLLGIGVQRVWLVVKYKQRVNTFPPSGEKGTTFAHRIGRAHANCYENLPVVLGVIFYAYATDNIAVTNTGALVFLVFRIIQSSVHLISTRARFVLLRFALFVVQCAILLYWLIKLWLLTFN